MWYRSLKAVISIYIAYMRIRVWGKMVLPALVLDLFLEDEDEEFFMALVPGEWHEDEGCLAGEKTAGAMAEWW